MTDPNAFDVFAFGPFELFPQQRMLLRDGEPVQVGARALDILLELVENAGSLVEKGQLIGRAWPGTHVEEVALRFHITALRKMLTTGRSGSRDLINIQGRGYQFVTPVYRRPGQRVRGAPPAAGTENSPNRGLPRATSRIIGRNREIEELKARVTEEPCVTIVGPGGIGKTTIGLAVAERLADQFKDGVFFVDLAPVIEPKNVADAIATAISSRNGGDPSTNGLAEFLRMNEALVLLDNCEQVSGAVAELLFDLLSQRGLARILATSREPLHLSGEYLYRIPTLETPEQSEGLSARDAMRYPAIELFAERASECSDRFVLDETNAPIIAAICGRLDGLALAIEMAASRLDKFGVADIATMLEDRFRILQRSQRTAVSRHASLLAALDWSYDMLRPEDQIFFQRIACFPSRFMVEDALAVAVDGNLGRADVVECLAELVDKSFISVDLEGPVAHYRLLETLREYGRQKAQKCGAYEAAKQRHAEFILEKLQKADSESEKRNTSEWLLDYSPYLGDVRAALDWFMRPNGESDRGISLTAFALPLWLQLSLLNELRLRVSFALAALGPAATEGGMRELKLFAALSNAIINLFGPTPEGTSACVAALKIARKIGDFGNQARALLALWNGCFAKGALRESLTFAEQFSEIAPRLGQADILVGHRMLGSSHFHLGDVVRARHHMEIMVAGYSATFHDNHMVRFGFGQLASGRGLLAFYLCYQGRYTQAMQTTRQSVEEALRLNHAMTICGVLATSSIQNSIYLGHLDDARRYVDLLFEHAQGRELKRWENFAFGYDGILAIRNGRFEDGFAKLSRSFAPDEDRANTRYMIIFCEYALALARAGCPKQGLSEINLIRDRLIATDAKWYLPEVYRCRALLQAAAGADPSDVIDSFSEGLRMAEQMGALTWQLRTAVSFAEFLYARGRAHEGAAALGQVYDLFEDDDAAPILAQAADLLQKLKTGT